MRNCPIRLTLPSVQSWLLGICALGICLCLNSLRADDRIAESPTVAFDREVVSSLTKLGCNSGTCHGSLHGKGGFRLSLRGQDPQLDYDSIANELGGRRLDPLDSTQSLILAKPSGDLPHQGGLKLPKDSAYYTTLRDWIEQGAAPPSSNNPRQLVSLELSPREVWLPFPNKEQQITAIAHWSDNTATDVTAWTRFECSSIHGAKVSEQGLVHASHPIDTTVSGLYLGQHASARMIFLPESLPTNANAPSDSNSPAWNELDGYVNARLYRLGILPEPTAAPEIVLRRLYLTTLGRMPRIDEQELFFSEPPENRLSQCIDRVLSDPGYSELWALKWSDLLRNEPKVMSEDGVSKWHDWLTQSMADDKPVDALVMEMITTLGSTYDNPPASFHRTHRDPTVAAESIGQVFLGIRMQCARCHNHPFDVWTQDDYYGLAAFLNPIERKQVDNMPRDKLDSHVITGDEIISMAEKPAVLFHPGRSKFIVAKGLGQALQFAPNDKDCVLGDQPLERLAHWIAKDNRQFARNMANRIWAHVMGRGIVDPPDDFRVSNPPSNPELLEYLTDQFIAHGYSTRWLTREILNSHTFTRASLTMAPDAEQHETALANFAGYTTKRMMAESLHDAILDVSGSSTHLKRPSNSKRDDDVEPGTQRYRAIQFPSVPKRNAMLRAFGKPERLIDCECERSSDLSLRQSLLLVNDSSIRAQLRDPNGNLARWSASLSIDQVIESIYRTGLCRRPTEQEWVALRSHVQGAANPNEALEDIAWAIINCKEFLFIR
jgi:hypothetical protein